MGRVPSDATAFARRDRQIMFHAWSDARSGTAQVERKRRAMERAWEPLRPYAAGTYGNFLQDEGEEGVRAIYPPATYERLVTIKNRYDPTNLFHHNHNIQPTGGGNQLTFRRSER